MQAATTSRRDEKYLRLLRAGNPIPTIARKCKVTPKTVYNGIARARKAVPIRDPLPRPVQLEALMPVLYLTPDSPCPHRGPIRDGEDFYCVVCDHASRTNDRLIARSKAPPIVEPDTRIARLDRVINESDHSREVEIAIQVRETILAAIGTDATPTSYVPHPTLRGGVG